MTTLQNLNAIDPTTKIKEYQFNNKIFTIQRVKNDINGNPVFKIKFNDTESHKLLKGKIGRTYLNKNYTNFSSYNVADTLESIFNILV